MSVEYDQVRLAATGIYATLQCCFFCMCRNHTHLCIAGGVENGTENPAMLASGVVYKHLYYMGTFKFANLYYLSQLV